MLYSRYCLRSNHYIIDQTTMNTNGLIFAFQIESTLQIKKYYDLFDIVSFGTREILLNTSLFMLINNNNNNNNTLLIPGIEINKSAILQKNLITSLIDGSLSVVFDLGGDNDGDDGNDGDDNLIVYCNICKQYKKHECTLYKTQSNFGLHCKGLDLATGQWLSCCFAFVFCILNFSLPGLFCFCFFVYLFLCLPVQHEQQVKGELDRVQHQHVQL